MTAVASRRDDDAMTTTAHHQAAPFAYVDVDIPDGQTLAEWRREHPGPAAHRPLRHALRGVARRIHRSH